MYLGMPPFGRQRAPTRTDPKGKGIGKGKGVLEGKGDGKGKGELGGKGKGGWELVLEHFLAQEALFAHDPLQDLKGKGKGPRPKGWGKGKDDTASDMESDMPPLIGSPEHTDSEESS